MRTAWKQRGSHAPTVVERGLSALRMPYPLACALVALLIGSPGQFLALYASVGGNTPVALRDTFYLAFNGTRYLSLPEAVLGNSVWVALLFSAPYLVRYLRRKVEAAERDLSSIQPHGETGNYYERVFGWLSIEYAPLAIAAPFFALEVYYFVVAQQLTYTYAYLVYVIPASAVASLFFATFMWVYATSLWGLHNFGRGQLSLTSYYRDAMLGLRPIGSISLALTRAYFLTVVLLGLFVLITPDLMSILLTVVVIAVGVAFFFLPMRNCHEKLVAARRDAQLQIWEEMEGVMRMTPTPTAADGAGLAPGDLALAIDGMRSMMLLELAEERAKSIPSWPVDTSILGHFAALLIGIMAIILSRIIQLALNL